MALLIACMVLGGASAAGVIANAVLQIGSAAILLALCFVRGRADAEEEATPGDRTLKIAVLLWIALLAVQTIPLPPALWTALPGRAAEVAAFRTLEIALPWMPITLTPEGTIASGLALLPVMAMLFLMLPREVRRKGPWAVTIVAIAVAELVLGLAQVAGGRNSPLYFYDYTNWGHTVGFFANANHHATLLLMATPFAAALATPLFHRRSARHDLIAKLIILGSLFAVIAGGVIVNGSRAGMLLLPVILILCGCMVRMDLTKRMPKLWLGLAGAAMLAGGIGAVSSGAIGREALGGPDGTSRAAIWARSWPIAQAHLPTGSGLGSFVPLYRSGEDPVNRPRTFVNHAHNDYLEWLMETGVPGLALLACFLAWYARQSRLAWSNPDAGTARAASIAIAAVLLHSLVDYPIRTAAIAALFALCCALLAGARRRAPERPGKHIGSAH